MSFLNNEDPRTSELEPVYRLLLSLFPSGESFRQWLSLGPEGSRIVENLPTIGSPSAIIFDGLCLAIRRGHLTTEFFARLLQEFPFRRQDIKDAAMSWELVSPRFHPPSTILDRPSRGSLLSRPFLAAIGFMVLTVLLALWGLRGAVQDFETTIHACELMCVGCRGLTGGWIVLPTGEHYSVDIDGGKLVFRCIPEGQAVAVVLEITDGNMNISYYMRNLVVTRDSKPIPFTDFIPGTPPGFSPELAVQQSNNWKRGDNQSPVAKVGTQPDECGTGAQTNCDSETLSTLAPQANLPPILMGAEQYFDEGMAQYQSQGSVSPDLSLGKSPAPPKNFTIDCGGDPPPTFPNTPYEQADHPLMDVPGVSQSDRFLAVIVQKSFCRAVEVHIDGTFAGYADPEWRGYLWSGSYRIMFAGSEIEPFRVSLNIPHNPATTPDDQAPQRAIQKTIPWRPTLARPNRNIINDERLMGISIPDKEK